MKKNILILVCLFKSIFVNAIVVTPSTKFLVLPGVNVTDSTIIRKINLQINAHAQVLQVLTNSSVFELSTDSMQFSNNVSLAAASVATNINLYIRAVPNIANKVFKGQVYFVHNTIDTSFNRIYLHSSSMPADSFYTVLSWNTKWFGDVFGCNCDTAVQNRNIKNILKEIQADVNGLQEVVNVSSVAGLANYIGTNYSSNFSTYCSFASSVSDVDFADGQKLAYVYNNKLFENIRTFGLCKSTTSTVGTGSSSPYGYFSSGRFPYAMQTVCKANGDTTLFLNLHAKASATNSDYNRRASGGVLIADSVSTQYSNMKTVLLGDYNDYLQGTIVSTQTVSPYEYMLTHGLNGLSLPSLYPNTTTYVSIANSLIDNFAVNNALLPNYVPNSFSVFSELTSAFYNYDDSISDHLPAMIYVKKYNSPVPAAVENIVSGATIAIAYYGNSIKAILPAEMRFVDFKLINSNGSVVLSQNRTNKIEIATTNFAPGLYILQMQWQGKVLHAKIMF